MSSAGGTLLRNPTRRTSSDDLKLVGRLVAVGALAVFLQNGFFSQLRVVDGQFDILPLVALATGFLTGPTGGATTGFGMGLLSDITLGTPLGLTSMLLTVVGEIGGRVGNVRDPEGIIVPMATGTVVTFGTLIAAGLLQLLLGAPSAASFDLVRAVVLTSVLSGLIAPLIYRSTRFGLVGVLARDPRRRRRAATTTRLSPLSTSRGQTRRRGRSVADGERRARRGGRGAAARSSSGRRRR